MKARNILAAVGLASLVVSGASFAGEGHKGKPMNCSVTDKKGKSKDINAKDQAACEGKHGQWKGEAPAAAAATPAAPDAAAHSNAVPATESHK